MNLRKIPGVSDFVSMCSHSQLIELFINENNNVGNKSACKNSENQYIFESANVIL